ncbi:hypothetical protein JW960_29305 [candidate division KSB1 bacterium]|nr:hypothetical protein [candidate division KSB1 bacterium]
MEFLLFRMLRLIDREINLYEKLYNCLQKQHDNIVEGNVLDLMVDMIEQNEIMSAISDIECDLKEDTVDLCGQLQIFSKEPNITMVVEALQDRYPRICEFFRSRGNKLDGMLTKVEDINTENIALLQNYRSVWQNVVPLYAAWADIDEYLNPESEKEQVDESVYEISLN